MRFNLFILFLFITLQVNSQCACNTAYSYGNIDVSSFAIGQTGTITTCQWSREYSTIYNTINGAIYLISTCGTNYDTQLTIYTPSCGYIAYNDDNGPACTGLQASVQFTSPGGTIYSIMNRYNCASQTSTCVTVTIKLINLPLPLPIELAAFNVWCNGNSRQGMFITMSENNTDKFILQSSEDGMFYNNIKTFAAAGISSTQRDYSWEDNDFYNPSTIFYKLVEYDLNGTSVIYGPYSSNCTFISDIIEVYPNPSEVGYPISIDGEYQEIEVYDLIGRTINVQLVNNQLIGLSAGAYVLIIDNKFKVQLIIY